MDLHLQLTVSSSLCSEPLTGQLAVLYDNIWSGDIDNITFSCFKRIYTRNIPIETQNLF